MGFRNNGDIFRVGDVVARKLVDYKVELMVLLCLVIGEWILLQYHANMMALSLLVGTCLMIVTANLQRPFWMRIVLLAVVYVVTATASWMDPRATPPGLLYGAVVSSFVAVRVSYRLGLLYCLLSVVGQLPVIVAYWTSWAEWDQILVYSVIGAMFVLSLQLYDVSRKLHQYRKLSIYDELTGLHNVRYFRYKLTELYEDPKVQTICLCLIDLDKFKSVNDALGHREGDHVLQRAARLLEEAAAPTVVSRYGGEEFVFLLPNQTLEQAVVVAERLRETLSSVSLCLLPVTLSCGISFVNGRDKSPEQLFDQADKALYEAKQARDRVLVYQDDPAHALAEMAPTMEGDAGTLTGQAGRVIRGGRE